MAALARPAHRYPVRSAEGDRGSSGRLPAWAQHWREVVTRARAAAAVVAVVVGAAGAAAWRLGQAPAVEAWQGYVDADYVKVAPTQQGLVTSLSVSRGDTVKAGASLFAQDDAYDRAARDET